MHKDRLLKLADLLEADAANPKGLKFDLGSWVAPADRWSFEQKPDAATIPISCGTSACAMGLAVLSGAFAEYGLTSAIIEREGPEAGKFNYLLFPQLGHATGFEAAEVLFAINDGDSRYLFDPDFYSADRHVGAEAERDVAARIRDFVVGTIDHDFYPSDDRYDD